MLMRGALFTSLIVLLLLIVGSLWRPSYVTAQALGVTGVSSTITPGILLAGACATASTITVPGARAGMVVVATPTSDLGVSTVWTPWISANDTVSLRICGLIGLTPAAITWNIRVIP